MYVSLPSLTLLVLKFAAHWTEDNDKGYYGVSALMDVYGLNLNHGQMSAGAIWIQNLKGDFDKNLNSIVVGWVVSHLLSL